MYPGVETTKSRWCFQICFMFTPILGKMIQFDLHIFFRWVASATNKFKQAQRGILGFRTEMLKSLVYPEKSGLQKKKIPPRFPLVHANNSGLLLKILAYVAISQHLVSKSPVLC